MGLRRGRKERLARRQGYEWLARCKARADAEAPANGLIALGTGPGYRWPIKAKCRLNPTRRSLVTRKAGLRDLLANMKYNGNRMDVLFREKQLGNKS